MPYRRRYRKKRVSKRKPRKTYRPHSNYNSSIQRFPLGGSKKVSFRYCSDPFVLNPGVGGTAATHIFSCNGLFDPDITGVGHQPSGFDELMTMFDHYTVIGAKARLTFRSIDSGNAQFVGVRMSGDVTLQGDHRVILENGQTKYRLIAKATDSGSATIADISMSVNVGKYLRRSKIMSDPDMKGSVAANPAEQCYFHAWCAPQEALDSSGVRCTAVIDYVAILHEPKTLALS